MTRNIRWIKPREATEEGEYLLMCDQGWHSLGYFDGTNFLDSKAEVIPLRFIYCALALDTLPLPPSDKP